jgi:hypothetical protein
MAEAHGVKVLGMVTQPQELRIKGSSTREMQKVRLEALVDLLHIGNDITAYQAAN